MKKFSLLEAIVLPTVSALTTLIVGSAPLFMGGYNSRELVFGVTALTPLIIAMGNTAIQKSHYKRNIFSIDNLEALGSSYLGGLAGGGVAKYAWHEYEMFLNHLHFDFGI